MASYGTKKYQNKINKYKFNNIIFVGLFLVAFVRQKLLV